MIEEKPKTSVFSCINIRSGVSIGVVKWHAPWRQYCYFPRGWTVYSRGCMEDIIDFINKLMEERKNDKS